VRKEQVSIALSKDLIKLIDKRRGRASRSAEVEYLIKLGLEHEKEKEVES
jgi:metal-responsive CopG/Arc/MetJ family transcriptional regulator